MNPQGFHDEATVLQINNWWQGVVLRNKDKRNLNKRVLKLKFMEFFSNCFWCGRPVFDEWLPEGQRVPDDQASIDHLVSRFFRKKGDSVMKVLACHKCNQKRALEENKIFNKIHIEKTNYEKAKQS